MYVNYLILIFHDIETFKTFSLTVIKISNPIFTEFKYAKDAVANNVLACLLSYNINI